MWSLALVGIKHFELFTIFQSGWKSGRRNMDIWCYQGQFQDTVTPDIDFTDDAAVQCDGPVIKTLF